MLKHLSNIPLTIIPLIVYLIVSFTFPEAGAGHPPVWDSIVFDGTLLSGGRFTLLLQHLLLIFALLFLFVEILKSTRQTSQEIYDHLFSMIAFIIYLVLFITVPRCAHAVFFLLMCVALIDVIAGFTVTIRTARRELSVERDTGI
jgi:hypothetical protein